MIARLQEELVRKKQAGVDLTGLTLWFNTKTFSRMMADLERAGCIEHSPLSHEQRERFYVGWTIMGVPVKLSDRVSLGAACVTMGADVLIEWDLTEDGNEQRG